jgi:protein TonB
MPSGIAMFPARGMATSSNDARRVGAIAAIAIHAAAVALIASYEPARSAMAEAAPIMIEWITPAAARPPEPVAKPKPPKLRPAEQPRTVEQPAARATPQPTPVLAVAPSAPSPVATAPAAPAATTAMAAPAPAAPPTAPLPAVIPPVFNANYLDNPAPPYPSQARRMGEQGRVVLRVHVSVTGRADEVNVQASSGSGRLDESARDTVRRWKFLPARRGSDPVDAWVLIPISFKLEG